MLITNLNLLNTSTPPNGNYPYLTSTHQRSNIAKAAVFALLHHKLALWQSRAIISCIREVYVCFMGKGQLQLNTMCQVFGVGEICSLGGGEWPQ